MGSIAKNRITLNRDLGESDVGIVTEVRAAFVGLEATAAIAIVAMPAGGPSHNPLTTDAIFLHTFCTISALTTDSDRIEILTDDRASVRIVTDAGEPALVLRLDPIDCPPTSPANACVRVIPNREALFALSGERMTFHRAYVSADGNRNRIVTFVVLAKTLKAC